MLQFPSPTKMFLLQRPDDPEYRSLFDLAFAKRPAEELYDLATDPYQMNNVAKDPVYESTRAELSARLQEYLRSAADPREVGGPMKWEQAQYFKESDLRPEPSPEAIDALGLDDRYSYID